MFAPGTPREASLVGSAVEAGGARERERTMADAPGRELAILLAAANLRAPEQLWPRDVPVTSELGRAFARHLEAWFARHDVERSPRWPTALDVASFAALSAQAGAGRMATPPPPALLVRK